MGAHPSDSWSIEIGSSDVSQDESHKLITCEGYEGKKYCNWLEDSHMLHSKFPNTRIMRFGYESAPFGQDSVSTRGKEIGKKLTHQLNKKREVISRGRSISHYVLLISVSVVKTDLYFSLHTATVVWLFST